MADVISWDGPTWGKRRGAQGNRNAKGLTQQEQLRVVQEFRSGGYNTLVCTSIGEEGLDIGEVDLIVCFDSQSSPTRMLQRMGRTGRARRVRALGRQHEPAGARATC